MSHLLPFAHAWLWLGLAVSTSLASQASDAPAHSASSELRGTYGNHGLWLSLGGAESGSSQAALDGALAQLHQDHRLEKADYVVLDLREGGAVSVETTRAVATELWGATQAPTQAVASSASSLAARRLKADARVFVIAGERCASSCQQAADAWKSQGAVELAVPAAVLGQDDLSVEAWVLATADAAHDSGKVAASAVAKQARSP